MNNLGVGRQHAMNEAEYKPQYNSAISLQSRSGKKAEASKPPQHGTAKLLLRPHGPLVHPGFGHCCFYHFGLVWFWQITNFPELFMASVGDGSKVDA